MTYCFVVTVLALAGLTKKRFDHYSILKLLSLRSPKPGKPYERLRKLNYE